jgi:2-amino-4-hydroxy-6-hydroxymethyldihydropteridine diphosphokinase
LGILNLIVLELYSLYNFNPMTQVLIGVGSNLGDREKHLQQACDFLGGLRGIRFIRSSQVRETDPVGGPAQGKYLNAVWQIETGLGLQELLKQLMEIERRLGRVRTEKNGPRTMDLDILFYGQEIIDQPGLTVPHPRLHERMFVLEPLFELAPDLVHPILKKTIKQLSTELSAQGKAQSAKPVI